MINAFLYFFLSWITVEQTDPCQLQGAVFIESSKRYADFVVYEESSEAFADLLVYKQENRLYADGPGLWFITDDRSMADYSIYLTEKQNIADFSIFYTDTESFAGCN